ncbi:MAG: transposase [Actinobacteria bacterium]|nr:transposase [Actinomycetota bacterium]
MPRKPRLDAPGLLYHIIARGIEGRDIFADDTDRKFFLERLGDVLKETSTPVYAFALIPNHFHLLLRRGKTPIATVMRKLLTGYAIHFNHRHKRCGHLFQNRYKGIVCEDGPYFLELIRYIHLNPVRAGIVRSLDELAGYPFSGHAYLVGRVKGDFFDQDAVRSHFSKTAARAKRSYLELMRDGLLMGRRPDLTGGGLRRSLGYPKDYPKERQLFDDRILGSGDFVEAILTETLDRETRDEDGAVEDLVLSACEEFGVSKAEILGKARVRPISMARATLACRLSRDMGLTTSRIAKLLSMTPAAASKAIEKGKVMRLDGKNN